MLTQKERTSIKKSALKWDLIEHGYEADAGRANCSLCIDFYISIDKDGAITHCRECPVFKKTGCTGCVGTPYQNFEGKDPETGLSIVMNPEDALDARREKNFLLSLLKE